MGLWLKQSTAVDVIVGPFVDKTDGNTAETGLTVTQAEVRLSKNGGNMAQKNEATSLVHDELGYYDCNLDATDTNTLGRLQLMIHESADALPVYHEYMVVTANVYDTLCSTDVLQADLTQMGGVAQSATDLKDFADAGYNPATDKVTGVLLCDQTTLVDTTTTNTDMITTAQVNTEVDNALNTAIPGAPTANSINERIAAIDDLTQAAGGGDLAAILGDTNMLQTDWVNGGRLDLILDTLALEATVAALNDITADTVWDEVMDTNAPANANSARELVNLIAGVLAGKSSGGGTATIVFRDLGDTKDRQSATVTADGNRTAVTVDGT